MNTDNKYDRCRHEMFLTTDPDQFFLFKEKAELMLAVGQNVSLHRSNWVKPSAVGLI